MEVVVPIITALIAGVGAYIVARSNQGHTAHTELRKLEAENARLQDERDQRREQTEQRERELQREAYVAMLKASTALLRVWFQAGHARVIEPSYTAEYVEEMEDAFNAMVPVGEREAVARARSLLAEARLARDPHQIQRLHDQFERAVEGGRAGT